MAVANDHPVLLYNIANPAFVILNLKMEGVLVCRKKTFFLFFGFILF